MRFTLTALSRCTGGGHYSGTISLNGGAGRSFTVTAAELAETIEDLTAKELIVARLRAAIREAAATTLVQIRTAIEGKEFHV